MVPFLISEYASLVFKHFCYRCPVQNPFRAPKNEPEVFVALQDLNVAFGILLRTMEFVNKISISWQLQLICCSVGT